MYGSWRLKDLKEELKRRGARVHGKKAHLVERLLAYDQNNNFQFAEDVFEEPKLGVPPPELYKDINADTDLPNLTCHRIAAYLDRSHKKEEAGQQMYRDGFLRYARVCHLSTEVYIRGAYQAEMKKHVVYNVDIKLEFSSWLEGPQCECAAGATYAHCKHVIVLLLAIEEMARNGTMVTTPTCTQTLQTFHKPSRPFYGSPVKNPKQCFSQDITRIVFNPVPLEFRDENYPSYFRNVVDPIRNSRMSLKGLCPLANSYFVVRDHTYEYNQSQCHQNMLGCLGLRNITEKKIDLIESSTVKQSKSKVWKQERNIRITSTNFYSAIKVVNNDYRGAAVANHLINPIPFINVATSYGKATEKIALQQYVSYLGDSSIVKESGLIIMKSHPYLACSPDGLIGTETVMEIKCPCSSRNQYITSDTISFLKLSDGELQLDKRHPYYYQIQGQLLCTNRKFANLLVYTSKEMKIFDIRRDEDFLDSMLCKLEIFHDKYQSLLCWKSFYTGIMTRYTLTTSFH